MKLLWKKPTIKQKLIVTLLLVIVVLCIISVSTLKISIYLYTRKLCNESVDVIRLAATTIDSRMQGLNRFSVGVISNAEIQNQLRAVKSSNSEYERTLASRVIEKAMYSHAFGDYSGWIETMKITDLTGSYYLGGMDLKNAYSDYVTQNIPEIIAANGSCLILPPNEECKSLIMACLIRSIPQLELENLGILQIYISPDQMVSRVFRSIGYDYNHLYIMDGNRLIFAGGDLPVADNIDVDFDASSGYEIATVGGERFLVAHAQSKYTGWRFFNIIPYNSITGEISYIQSMMFLAFFTVTICVLLWGIRQVNIVAMPIDTLSRNLKQVGDDILSKGIPNIVPHERKEKESFLMDREFYHLVEEINHLVTTDYQRKMAVKEWELRALRAQINPHFLYNTLDSIHWIACVNSQDAIAEMSISLANLLRNSICGDDFITLSDECGLLEDYITIQTIRYERRLDFSKDIDEELHDYLIPRMILQPIVENSISYVLEKIQGVCSISVRTVKRPDDFDIIVSDNGDGSFVESYNSGTLKSKGTGIGLKNIDSRVKLLCGEQYGLLLQRCPQGTCVTVRLPHICGPEEKERGAVNVPSSVGR